MVLADERLRIRFTSVVFFGDNTAYMIHTQVTALELLSNIPSIPDIRLIEMRSTYTATHPTFLHDSTTFHKILTHYIAVTGNVLSLESVTLPN